MNIKRKLGVLTFMTAVAIAPQFGGILTEEITIKAEAAIHFSDISKHWAKDTIYWALEKGIVKGYEDGTFKPNNQVTEAEFLAMLIRTYKPEIQSTKEGHWADVFYQFAREMNYPILGSDEIGLRNESMTRSRVAELISAAQGVNYAGEDAIRFMYANKLASGSDPSKITIRGFNGEGTLTRAEAVQFIKNLVEHGKGELLARPQEPSDPTLLPEIPSVEEGQAQSMENSSLGEAYVDGKEVSGANPIYRENVLYVPLKQVAEGMGDQFEWKTEPVFAVVKQDGKEIYVSSYMSIAKVNGKDVLISTETVTGSKAPGAVKPFVNNKMLYVPAEFVKNVLEYPVEVKKIGNLDYVFVGELPKQMPTPAPQPAPKPDPKPQLNPDVKLDLPYKVPADWVPPQIKSVATDNHKKNKEALKEELGFVDGRFFNPYGGIQPELAEILVSGDEDYLASIEFYAWYGSKTSEHPSNKIPYVARELFKFYLPHDYDTLFKIIEDGVNGKDVSKYYKPFTLDGRQIKIIDKPNSFAVVIGYKGKNLK